MRQANVLFRNEEAGVLTQLDVGAFTFQYHESWLNDDGKPGISLTLLKEQSLITHLPFFFLL